MVVKKQPTRIPRMDTNIGRPANETIKGHADSSLYCKECSKKNPADAKFCAYCGKEIQK